MIKITDKVLALIGLIILTPVIVILTLIGILDTGKPYFKQKRMGKNKIPFYIIKFRSMRLDTLSEATHLISASRVTIWGKFLRSSKLDEIPQLLNILKGDMSIVGPRPNLFNQFELISERDKYNVYSVLPGITGLSQISNIDMSKPQLLARTDASMINKMNISMYWRYILLTLLGRGRGDNLL